MTATNKGLKALGMIELSAIGIIVISLSCGLFVLQISSILWVRAGHQARMEFLQAAQALLERSDITQQQRSLIQGMADELFSPRFLWYAALVFPLSVLGRELSNENDMKEIDDFLDDEEVIDVFSKHLKALYHTGILPTLALYISSLLTTSILFFYGKLLEFSKEWERHLSSLIAARLSVAIATASNNRGFRKA